MIRHVAPTDNVDHCGCCGHPIDGVSLWCALCQPHVGVVGHLWDRTYFARTGQDCPYEAFPRPTAEAVAQYRSDLHDLEEAEHRAAVMSTQIVIKGTP